MHAETLKNELLLLGGDDGRIDDQDRHRLTEAMLEHVGALDPQLRDDLIYERFSRWIHAGLYPNAELEELLGVCWDTAHLMCFPTDDEDAVFTRAFSQLIIADILLWHRQRGPSLAPEVVAKTAAVLLSYMQTETDRRGYVPDKGWAHAIAHLADTLKALLPCSEIPKAVVMRMLDAVREQIGTRDLVYSFGEDERMASALLSVLKRQDFSEADLAHWLDSVSFTQIGPRLPGDYLAAMNRKHFLRSIYFQMRSRGVYPWLTAHVDALLQKVQQSRLI